MCENACSFYEDNFSEDVHYKKLIQLYNLIINNKKVILLLGLIECLLLHKK